MTISNNVSYYVASSSLAVMTKLNAINDGINGQLINNKVAKYNIKANEKLISNLISIINIINGNGYYDQCQLMAMANENDHENVTSIMAMWNINTENE